jgi:heterodisulfide reductase subunit B
MSHYGFFPGCSLERNAAAYTDSIRAVATILGMDLEEIDDWNCCGATEYIALNKLAAYALVGRTLALAEQQLQRMDTRSSYSRRAARSQPAQGDRMMGDRDLREATNQRWPRAVAL